MRRLSGFMAAALGAYLLVGTGVATAGDHLKCWKPVKESGRIQVEAANKQRPVSTLSNTGLPAQSGCTVDNRKAKICCDAVDKVPGGPPTGALITNRFCCYKMKCPSVNPVLMAVNDQFRAGTIENKKTAFLCVPGTP